MQLLERFTDDEIKRWLWLRALEGASSVLCKRPFFSLRRRRIGAVGKWES